MGVLKPPFQKNPCKGFVETAKSYPETYTPELPHLVTKPPHITTKEKLHNIQCFFCGSFKGDVVLSRVFFLAFEILCLMRQTTLQSINIEDK